MVSYSLPYTGTLCTGVLNWTTGDLPPQDFTFLEDRGCIIDLCCSTASGQNDAQEIPRFSGGNFCSVGKVQHL